jgi:hypothetical protein
MDINFSYSLIAENKEVLSLLFHGDRYTHLRSVVQPSVWHMICFAIRARNHVARLKAIWSDIAELVEQAFREFGLKDLGIVSCYVHGVSCEGWFDVDRNAIHVRMTSIQGNEKRELSWTIIHELVHLATYQPGLSYEQRERMVDEYLNKPQFRKIVDHS